MAMHVISESELNAATDNALGERMDLFLCQQAYLEVLAGEDCFVGTLYESRGDEETLIMGSAHWHQNQITKLKEFLPDGTPVLETESIVPICNDPEFLAKLDISYFRYDTMADVKQHARELMDQYLLEDDFA